MFDVPYIRITVVLFLHSCSSSLVVCILEIYIIDTFSIFAHQIRLPLFLSLTSLSHKVGEVVVGRVGGG